MLTKPFNCNFLSLAGLIHGDGQPIGAGGVIDAAGIAAQKLRQLFDLHDPDQFADGLEAAAAASDKNNAAHGFSVQVQLDQLGADALGFILAVKHCGPSAEDIQQNSVFMIIVFKIIPSIPYARLFRAIVTSRPPEPHGRLLSAYKKDSPPASAADRKSLFVG